MEGLGSCSEELQSPLETPPGVAPTPNKSRGITRLILRPTSHYLLVGAGSATASHADLSPLMASSAMGLLLMIIKGEHLGFQ